MLRHALVDVNAYGPARTEVLNKLPTAMLACKQPLAQPQRKLTSSAFFLLVRAAANGSRTKPAARGVCSEGVGRVQKATNVVAHQNVREAPKAKVIDGEFRPQQVIIAQLHGRGPVWFRGPWLQTSNLGHYELEMGETTP